MAHGCVHTYTRTHTLTHTLTLTLSQPQVKVVLAGLHAPKAITRMPGERGGGGRGESVRPLPLPGGGQCFVSGNLGNFKLKLRLAGCSKKSQKIQGGLGLRHTVL